MFQFKQFKVEQDRCAMKVCTDSCIFGAWVAKLIRENEIVPKRILDIGTGTGLLSLMIAQVSDANIKGIDIDETAIDRASENFSGSAFCSQLSALHMDARCFTADEKFDLIISNPPFYEEQLKSPDSSRNTAMHAAHFGYEDLMKTVERNLSGTGNFAVLLPHSTAEAFTRIAKTAGCHSKKRLDVAHSEKHPFTRSCMLFSATAMLDIRETLFIKTDANQYSKEFQNLLKDYYLNF